MVKETIQRELPNLFKTYPDLSSIYPTSYILCDNEGNFKSHYKEVCHASIVYSKPDRWDQLILAVPNKENIALSYIHMMINGPFKSYSDLIDLVKDGEHYYLYIDSLHKWPANVLYNFCIASRIPIEYNFILDRWNNLISKGYQQILAFLLSASTFGLSFTGKRDFIPNNHFPFNIQSYWPNIINGNMVKLSENFKKNPRACRPSNVIWGCSDDVRKLSSMTDEEVSNYYNLPIQKISKVVFNPLLLIEPPVNLNIIEGPVAGPDEPQPFADFDFFDDNDEPNNEPEDLDNDF